PARVGCPSAWGVGSVPRRAVVEEGDLVRIAEQQEWLLAFVCSAKARAAARSILRDNQLGWYDADDLCSDCAASLMTTCRNTARRSETLPDVADADSAERYARQALKRRALDLFRRERRTPPRAEPRASN